MQTELGQQKLETRARLQTFKYWLKIHFHKQTKSLLQNLVEYTFSSGWFKKILQKLQLIGLNITSLIAQEEGVIIKLVMQRLGDQEAQLLRSSANGICSPQYWNIPLIYRIMPLYLQGLDECSLTRAYL